MCVHVLSYACVQAHPCHSDPVEVRKERQMWVFAFHLVEGKTFFLVFLLGWPRASGDSPVCYACNLRDCRHLLHGRLFMSSVVSNSGPHAYVAGPFTH